MAVSLWKSLLQTTKIKLFLQRGVSLYNSAHGFEEEEIKKKLQQFGGGSINLSKEDNGIGILTLNNPKLMNAFTGTMMLELQERVTELENWKDGKGLIIHGAENTFCSGSDLSAVRAMSSPQDGMNMCMFMQNTLTSLKRLPLISVALVQGKALGGGAEFTTACDFRFQLLTFVSSLLQAEENLTLQNLLLIDPKFGIVELLAELAAKIISGCEKMEHIFYCMPDGEGWTCRRLMTPGSEIRFVHKQMGLVPGWGGAARLVQIVGSGTALKLLSGALKVDPERAVHLGLAEETLLSSDEIRSLEEAQAWLNQYTKAPAAVIQAVKKVVTAGRELQLEAALQAEKDIFVTVWGGPANLQALAQGTKHK